MRKAVLLILLLTLSVQGFAHGLSSALCDPTAEHAAMAAGLDEHHPNEQTTRLSDDSSHGGSNHPPHSCCHRILWASVQTTELRPPSLGHALVSSHQVMPTLFVPEQPQHPPPSPESS